MQHAGAAQIVLPRVGTLSPPENVCRDPVNPTTNAVYPWAIDFTTLLHHDPLLCDHRQNLLEESAHLRTTSAATSEITMRLHATSEHARSRSARTSPPWHQ
ncbi:hypothetical protein HBI56_031280 [Parastagonospora nodorum]|uniref:Uncharacterized protein n=1 Tax=Phaeosphaeria nodorum (strain SN15 / ATCC MYA-4574 / FGSC 10173) TaxID=321614 RepID=A0A7U2I0H1_PHANO|nr:hypothetical protein HBH56_018990 [Parastagonospora nodorum]QRC95311.1 hypothetical protein JI435_302240 [Parastagonospora nodorum SN15]KAH3937516.1 hypothetical protein HBH54_015500 [Parastagonospora nodorum]KAH3953691.1 hypothetical protein HBH53_027670 [Parastagonospora nodorum]KAH3962562.1 hypothetical protein HBH51_174150 [Parastagonospora nodorum]